MAREQRRSDPPYRGFAAFEPEHERFFFGRSVARNELRELLARAATRGVAFVLVIGGSGSGKSSLVKAGLVPGLAKAGMIEAGMIERERVDLVRTAIMRPGAAADPLSALVSALLAPGALPELGTSRHDEKRLVALLCDEPEWASQPIREGLSAAGSAAGLTSAGKARLLLVVDQLEELFTVAGVENAARERFVVALAALARSGLVWVVATLRSDFFERLNQMQELARLWQDGEMYMLMPPTAADVGQIVRQPAREAGLRFGIDRTTGQHLYDTIVADSDPVSLPLLEFVLYELWRRRDGDRLTFAAYNDLGGLKGAISALAEEALAAQPQEVRAALPRLLRSLVTVRQDGSVESRQADISTFVQGTPVRRLIDELLAPSRRLLVADGESIRIAHEALLHHWARARDCIEIDREDLRLLTRLEDLQARWHSASAADRESLLLASGLPVAEAKDLVDRRGDELSGPLRAYIALSAQADFARAKQSRNRTLTPNSQIFISYRRGDQPGYARAVYERLAKVFSAKQLFLDVDSVPAGVDFVEYLHEQVNNCDVVLAIIGDRWRGERGPDGKYRIEQDDDFVRIEIAAALASDKWVIPILIDQTQIPGGDLPPSLKGLAQRQAIRITNERFEVDVERVIREMKRRFEET